MHLIIVILPLIHYFISYKKSEFEFTFFRCFYYLDF